MHSLMLRSYRYLQILLSFFAGIVLLYSAWEEHGKPGESHGPIDSWIVATVGPVGLIVFPALLGTWCLWNAYRFYRDLRPRPERIPGP